MSLTPSLKVGVVILFFSMFFRQSPFNLMIILLKTIYSLLLLFLFVCLFVFVFVLFILK